MQAAAQYGTLTCLCTTLTPAAEGWGIALIPAEQTEQSLTVCPPDLVAFAAKRIASLQKPHPLRVGHECASIP